MKTGLPIAEFRDQIIKTVTQNQVTVVVGETGSGKTTAIPQYLYEAGLGEGGIIGITEPRRIAAVSVAKFVAENIGTTVGGVVAHKVRFDDQIGSDTEMVFLTDGTLLQEFHEDPMLKKYSVIMVDEAHERSAIIDFLTGLIKRVLANRPELRLVITSATIDAEKFSDYYGGAPIIQVSGRMYPVEIKYQQSKPWDAQERAERIVELINEIDRGTPGDVLVFLPGVDEINLTATEIERNCKGNLVVLPAHGGLTPEEQSNIFRNYVGKRKVILATNIAETSITIDGVTHVIDSGLVKQVQFDPESGIQSLVVVNHSRSGCDQRAGRAGRTQPGTCYRLFPKSDFDSRREFTEPEIRRMSLAKVVLTMEALGIEDVVGFDFIDAPDHGAFVEAYNTLKLLGAIDGNGKGLTAIGRKMASLPTEPAIARMLIEAEKFGCVAQIATIASFMSAGSRSVFSRPRDKEYEADSAHRQFKDHRSDMLTTLKIWSAYKRTNGNRDWCYRNFLNSKVLEEVEKVRSQLIDQLERLGVKITEGKSEEAILRCIASGLLHNLIRHDSRHEYAGVVRDLLGVYIHPGSSTFGCDPQWVVMAKVVNTTRCFAQWCSQVETGWLIEMLPSKFKAGETLLEEYSDENRSAVARQKILMYDATFKLYREIGSWRKTISIEEARAIQNAQIRKAVQGGLVLIHVDRAYGRLSQIKGRDDTGHVYQMSSYGSMPGCSYYCKIEEWIGNTNYASPQFRVFRLPEAKPAMVSKEPSPTKVSPVIDPGLAEALKLAMTSRGG